MGQGGEQILHWETKEEVLEFVKKVDHHHVIKHPERVAEMAVCYNGKTINDLCKTTEIIAEGILYRKWHAVFLGFGQTAEDKDRDEFDTELFYFYNTIICNSER